MDKTVKKLVFVIVLLAIASWLISNKVIEKQELEAEKSIETENIPEYSIFKVMREMNKPEMKRALGFFVTFMKNMAAKTNNNNNLK